MEMRILDGAMGTELMKRGYGSSPFPEEVNLTAPEVVREIQRAYVEAGSQVLYTCTFGVNRRRVLLEVLEGDIEAAMTSAEATLDKAGYSKSKESSDGGRYDAVFVKHGFPTLVFMAQTPDRGPDLKNPGAVGTIHIMWNIY